MADQDTKIDSSSDREIRMERIFDAPRELVWQAFTDPRHLGQWWGPNGFTTTTYNMDVRPGGVWRFCLHGPDGVDYQNLVTYIEVTKPSRLVYKHGGAKDVEPVNFTVFATFDDVDGKTKLTWKMVFPSPAAKNYVVEKYGAIEGAKQTQARLAEHLKTMQEAQ